MVNTLPKLIARYWIAVVVLLFALLSAYTSSPIYGQSTEPTPDVNTVPRPGQLATPTNTPFPTPTPIIDDGLPGGGDSGGNDDSSGGNSGGGGFIEPDPTATSLPDNNDNDVGGSDGDNGGGGSSGGSSGGGFVDNSTIDNVGDDNSNAPFIDEPVAEIIVDENSTDLLVGVVNAITLNVRRGPSTDEGIIDTVFLNETVTLFSRDDNNRWFRICCGASGKEGWVSAQYVTPNFASAEAETLLPITANSDASSADDADEIQEELLILEMKPSPAFAWQGQIVEMQFILRNESDQAFTNVRLRNDLPPTLLYFDSTVNNDGKLITTGQVEDGLIYAINWPEVPAGGQVTATVTLQIAEDVDSGALVDNLAVVDTFEGASALAGITFAMPPVRLPIFR